MADSSGVTFVESKGQFRSLSAVMRARNRSVISLKVTFRSGRRTNLSRTTVLTNAAAKSGAAWSTV